LARKKSGKPANKAKNKIQLVNIDDLNTWVKYKKGLCDDCNATCCTLPVEVRLPDLVRMELISEFEAQPGAEKAIAKQLNKQGIIQHFNHKTSVFTLARMANDDCLYLDKHSRRCTIYNKRPTTCREHPQVGPKPNHCAYIPRRIN
jgi:Fe-S-cluster containining protein